MPGRFAGAGCGRTCRSRLPAATSPSRPAAAPAARRARRRARLPEPRKVSRSRSPTSGTSRTMPVIEVLVKAGRYGEGRGFAGHARIRKGDHGCAFALRRRDQGSEGQGRRQGQRRQRYRDHRRPARALLRAPTEAARLPAAAAPSPSPSASPSPQAPSSEQESAERACQARLLLSPAKASRRRTPRRRFARWPASWAWICPA